MHQPRRTAEDKHSKRAGNGRRHSRCLFHQSSGRRRSTRRNLPRRCHRCKCATGSHRRLCKIAGGGMACILYPHSQRPLRRHSSFCRCRLAQRTCPRRIGWRRSRSGHCTPRRGDSRGMHHHRSPCLSRHGCEGYHCSALQQQCRSRQSTRPKHSRRSRHMFRHSHSACMSCCHHSRLLTRHRSSPHPRSWGRGTCLWCCCTHRKHSRCRLSRTVRYCTWRSCLHNPRHSRHLIHRHQHSGLELPHTRRLPRHRLQTRSRCPLCSQG